MYRWNFQHYARALCIVFAAVLAAGCGGDGENGNFKPTPGATVDLSGVVSGNLLPLNGAAVEAFLAGNPDTPESATTTNSTGDYLIAVSQDAAVSRSYSADGFATTTTIYRSFSVDTVGLDVDLITDSQAQGIIDGAFGGMMFDLADKAWLAVRVTDDLGNEIGGVTITTDDAVDGGGALDCNGLFNGTDTTEACAPARNGPMYLAYFDSGQEISIRASGSAISFSGGAPVRRGEITQASVGQ